jgi:hypothetical protein
MIQTLSGDTTPKVHTLISVNPDRLIELGHKLKAHAMDFAQYGETLTVPLTDRIWLVYEPTLEYCKPEHKFGSPAILAMAPVEDRLQ